MVQAFQGVNRDRIGSALAVAALHALLGYLLLTGLGFKVAPELGEKLKLFDVPEDPVPPPLAEPARPEAERQKPRMEDPEGAASPANLRDTPSPVVVPPPAIRLKIPSPVVAAPVAGAGNRPSAGAADVPGPGTGSGGEGTGTGSGSAGSGTGGGGGGGATRARLIRGSIDGSDYPRSAVRARLSGTVGLRFVVGPTGRVESCAVTRSSGSPELDETTCRLILRRFRYRPARDVRGRPVADVIVGAHDWRFELRRPPPGMEPIELDPDEPLPDDGYEIPDGSSRG